MKKIMIIILFHLSSLPLFAETPLAGKIEDTNLDESGNPFIVTDNITVPSGKTLNIGEGVIILFQPFTGLVIDGSLVAEGTLENPIVFTSDNDTKYNPKSMQLPNPFDWNGILITSKAKTVKLSNFVLEYSVYGVKSLKEEFIISNGTFTRNGQYNVTVNDAIKNVVDNVPFNFGEEIGTEANDYRKPQRMKKASNSPEKSITSSSRSKPLSIGIGVAGLAAIGAGGYFFYSSTQFSSQYEAATTQKKADEYFYKENSALTKGAIFAIGGAVSVACGIVVYSWKSESDKGKKVAIIPLLGNHNGILITFNNF